VEHTARYEDVQITLREPVHGLTEVAGVLGIPEWWPTGARIGIALGHSASANMDTPLLVSLQQQLTNSGFLTIRFNFPFAQARKKKADAQPILEDAFRAALNIFARDATAAPAHLFIGGINLGAEVVASLCAKRLRADGVFLMGYPLHPVNKPEEAEAQKLFRAIAPLLFIEGTRNRYCNLDALRKTMLRIGAPNTLHVVKEADHQFHVTKKSGRTAEEVEGEVGTVIDSWIRRLLDT